MAFLPAAARSLHNRRVRLHDFVIERASLFPFFDREGEVRSLMLVWPPSRKIVMLDHRSDLARVRFWGEIQLCASYASLRDVCDERADGAVGSTWLWHYDPWWVLRADRFHDHPAVPALKATNCAGGFLKPVYGCYFSRDLSRLVGVTTKARTHTGLSALDTTYRVFSPELLPEKSSLAGPPRPPRPAKEWTLEPFWLRQNWRRSPALVPPSSSIH